MANSNFNMGNICKAGNAKLKNAGLQIRLSFNIAGIYSYSRSGGKYASFPDQSEAQINSYIADLIAFNSSSIAYIYSLG